MNPTKRKEISKVTAEQLQMDVNVVDDVVSFFYRTLQKKMSSLSYHAINVPNLGTFTIKRKALEKKIEKYTTFCDNLDESESIRAYEVKQDVRKEIERLRATLLTMNEEILRKTEVNKLKEEYLENAE